MPSHHTSQASTVRAVALCDPAKSPIAADRPAPGRPAAFSAHNTTLQLQFWCVSDCCGDRFDQPSPSLPLASTCSCPGPPGRALGCISRSATLPGARPARPARPSRGAMPRSDSDLSARAPCWARRGAALSDGHGGFRESNPGPFTPEICRNELCGIAVHFIGANHLAPWHGGRGGAWRGGSGRGVRTRSRRWRMYAGEGRGVKMGGAS